MKIIYNLFLFSLIPLLSLGQGGSWTWISGVSTVNSNPVYGIQGVPSVNNHPPLMYEGTEFKDKQGNFWIYEGRYNNNLWKYDPTTNEWTWVKGDGNTFNYANYGTKGIANPSNSPGPTVNGTNSWVDTSGNFWIFGSASTVVPLWKFDLSTNNWTWMNGDTIWNSGTYGTQGIPSISNSPAPRAENCSAWTDSLNNLWLFGGQGYPIESLNDLCRYDIATNEWTWMKGSPTLNCNPNYGVKGVSSTSNDPGGRFSYTKWKDLKGKFWLMGGARYDSTGGGYDLNDVWEYDENNNEWIWMYGPNTPNDSGNYQNMCNDPNILNLPCTRMEHRSAVSDNCGRFWLFGGFGCCSNTLDDLWMFDPTLLKWEWLYGSRTGNQVGNYGQKGITSPSNAPPSRGGALAWWGNDNKFYLFGGWGVNGQFCDLWVFNPDSNCVPTCSSVIAEVLQNNTSNYVITVSPNPATTQLAIHIPSTFSNTSATITIINVLGETMKEEKIKWSNEETLNISSLKEGMYVLQITIGDERLITRFIKS